MTAERRRPTKARSIVAGGVVVLVGLMFATAAVVIALRAGGDLSTVVGTLGAPTRSGGAAPAWFAIGVTSVLALLASAAGVFVAVVGWREADAGERERSLRTSPGTRPVQPPRWMRRHHP